MMNGTPRAVARGLLIGVCALASLGQALGEPPRLQVETIREFTLPDEIGWATDVGRIGESLLIAGNKGYAVITADGEILESHPFQDPDADMSHYQIVDLNGDGQPEFLSTPKITLTQFRLFDSAGRALSGRYLKPPFPQGATVVLPLRTDIGLVVLGSSQVKTWLVFSEPNRSFREFQSSHPNTRDGAVVVPTGRGPCLLFGSDHNLVAVDVLSGKELSRTPILRAGFVNHMELLRGDASDVSVELLVGIADNRPEQFYFIVPVGKDRGAVGAPRKLEGMELERAFELVEGAGTIMVGGERFHVRAIAASAQRSDGPGLSGRALRLFVSDDQGRRVLRHGLSAPGRFLASGGVVVLGEDRLLAAWGRKGWVLRLFEAE